MRTPAGASHPASGKFGRRCAAVVLCLAIPAAFGQAQMEREGIVLHWGLVSPGPSQQLALMEMHGGMPVGGGKLNHLVLALFDVKTGQRIDNAIVRAQLCEPGIVDGPPKYLALMTVDHLASYGHLFGMVENGPYRFKVSVKLPGRAHEIEYALTAAPHGPMAMH